MAGGRRGVDKTISILRTEIERTMKLLEVATLDELGPQHVTQLARLTPIAKPVADAAEAAASSKPTTVRSPRPSSATKAVAAKQAASKPATSKPASRNSVTKG